MAIKTINQLDNASLPLLSTDKILVSRDGLNVNRANIADLPISPQVAQVVKDSNGNIIGLKNDNGSIANSHSLGEFYYLLKQNNVDLTGVTDSSAALQAVFDSYRSTGNIRKRAIFPQNSKIKINSGIIIDISVCSVDFNGLYLDASGMTSGYALTLAGQTVTPFNTWSPSLPVGNLALVGPLSNSNNTDGIRMLGNSVVAGYGDVGDGQISNVIIRGFRDGLVFTNNAYICSFANMYVTKNWRYGINFSATVNAGENLNFHGGSISDNQYVSGRCDGSASAIYVDTNASSVDMYFYGVSFSYNDRTALINAGTVNLFGCHEENNSPNPFVTIKYTGGKGPVQFAKIGGTTSPNVPLGTITEPTDGRTSLYLIDSTSGDKATISIKDCLTTTYGMQNTEIVTYTGTGYPRINYIDSDIVLQASKPPRISRYTTMMVNGSFEATGTYNTSSVPGWTVSGTTTNYTFTQDSTIFTSGVTSNNGTKSLKIDGVSGAASCNIDQIFRVIPGRSFFARGSVNITSYTSGTLYLVVQYLDQANNIITTHSVYTGASSTTGFILSGAQRNIPAGTSSIRVRINPSSFIGTVYIDDVDGWIV